MGTISQLEQCETKQQKYIDEPADIAVQCACISKQIWVVYICSSFLNDQFYNPFSRTGARTRQKLAKWVVKPNHYKALGFTTHLTNFFGFKVFWLNGL